MLGTRPLLSRYRSRLPSVWHSVWLGLCNLVVQWARKPPTVWLPSGLGGMRESPTIGSAGRITGQAVSGSTVQRQPLQLCAKISSENRALFFEMPPSFKILKCNWMWPGRAGLGRARHQRLATTCRGEVRVHSRRHWWRRRGSMRACHRCLHWCRKMRTNTNSKWYRSGTQQEKSNRISLTLKHLLKGVKATLMN